MPEKPLEILVGEFLRQRGLSLAVAESCTGGLLGNLITNVPGASEYFTGGVIAYANEVKTSFLSISEERLETFGAVSEEIVLDMARGVRRFLKTDIGLSTSGIAGPGGGTPGKPVGTTWIGMSTKDYEDAWCFWFPGDRLQVKEQAAQTALMLLFDYLANH